MPERVLNAGVETPDFAAMMRRQLGAWRERLADADLVDVAELVNFAAEVEQALGAVVISMRAYGRSWTEIGEAVGTTRQAAQQRWGRLV